MMRWNRCFVCGKTTDCEHRDQGIRDLYHMERMEQRRLERALQWERIEERRLERALQWQRIAGEKEPERQMLQ